MFARKTSKKELSRVFKKKKSPLSLFSFAMLRNNVLAYNRQQRSSFIVDVNKYSTSLRRRRISTVLLSFSNVKINVNVLRWMLLLIILVVPVITIGLFAQQAGKFFIDIFIYSFMGFITFFMGYFGWRFAQMLRELVKGKKVNDSF